MIDLELIQSVIVGGLTAHLGIPVVKVDAARPEQYPYIMYSYSGPITFPDSTPAMTLVAAGAEEVMERYTEQPTCRISLNSCSNQQLESWTNAIRMHDWFRVVGHDVLKQGADLVVVQAGKIKNRDTAIEGVWERRSQLYVTFRTASVVDMNQGTIQTVNWK
ncbi:hypothetical protein SAMN03159341_103185 [Paenibacillus sp. 1_12]|uniref:phage neck terminator protein n=1 Tax=Paenibacillus sp. 1_12 TaxID=1566278 RepID=UPI0008E1E181|nr:hypothetical protein [Paenibacillus sp. 1_12]SFL09563.1 hypothetical protein SAMN03159341_103185 [Paenibacillus sp. 1_12]